MTAKSIWQKAARFSAKLSDNPLLEATGYDATIDALPEPMRSLMKGKFVNQSSDSIWQVIPSEWIYLAQQRWREGKRPDVKLTALGVDVARGKDGIPDLRGDDSAIAKRYGNWIEPLLVQPGHLTPDGRTMAGWIVSQYTDDCEIIIDAIGIGSSPRDFLKENKQLKVHDLIASEAARDARGYPIFDRTGKLGFRNVRAAMWWKFREALDPEFGDNIALPPDSELAADLAAPHWTLSSGTITVESKDDIRVRIKRSTNRADAVLMAFTFEWLFFKPGLKWS